VAERRWRRSRTAKRICRRVGQTLRRTG
jgi:hypothetical protein